MNNNLPPEERKLFLVARTPTASMHPHKPRHRLSDFATYVLIPLTVISVVVMAVAGYLFLYGDAGRAKDFVLIFLPPIAALLGVASAAGRRN